MPEAPAILIVDDEPANVKLLASILEPEGVPISAAFSGKEALRRAEKIPLRMVLLDLSLPDLNGEEVLRELSERWPDVPVIIVTVDDQPDTIVRCMKAGAFDYLVKPVDPLRVRTVKRHVDERLERQAEIHALRAKELRQNLPAPLAELIGETPAFISALRYADHLSSTRHPVLITGETGTGKCRLARAIHEIRDPQTPLNRISASETDALVAALEPSEDHAEDLLIFEISDLTLEGQGLLLQHLVDTKTGANLRCPRLLMTSRHDSGWLSQAHLFRPDLFHHLLAHRIHLPTLRERKVDLPHFIERALDEEAQSLGSSRPRPPRGLVALLENYSFPGNIRELHNMMRGALIRHTRGPLALSFFREWIYRKDPEERTDDTASAWMLSSSERPLPTLKEGTRFLVRMALENESGNISRAARILGISRQALSKRLLAMGTEDGDE